MISFLRLSIRRMRVVPLVVLLMPAVGTAGHAALPVGNTCGTWSIVLSSNPGTGTAALNGVSGTSDRDVWVVGYHANPSGDRQTLIEHWNGKILSTVASPPGAHGGALSAVAALSPTNAWAVGDGPLTEHWTGAKWSVVPSPQPSHDPRQPAWLRSITALSPTNIWVAGTNWRAKNLTLIEHWNGRRWSVVFGPGTGRVELNGVTALSPTDILAVGFDGRALDRAASEHWNGLRWVRDSIDGGGLVAVAAASPKDAWAVGGSAVLYQNGPSWNFHWNGSTWNRIASPNPGTLYSALTGVTALSSTDVWAVGYAGRTIPGDGYAERALIEHWNGSAWSLVSTSATGSPDSQLLGVTSLSSGTVWAVGFTGQHRTSGAHPLIERYTRC